MENIIVIVGPTASGKTAMGINLAKEINGEIISADSMQIYKYMDIGTAKPSSEEMDGIKHYLIDEVNPGDEFSVVKFKELALQYIKEIINKGKTPIILGGTGLYINSLVHNIEFSDAQVDWEYRNFLQKESKEKGNEYIHSLLMEIDQTTGEKLHVNDSKRIIRALEVFKTSGKPISYHLEVSRLEAPEYNFLIFGLTMDRKLLYDRINLRVDKMIEQGLVNEVKSIVEKGYDGSRLPMQAIGYKEIIRSFKGECTLEEAVEIIKMESRRFAKRQLTWFRRLENVDWFEMDKEDNREILKKIQDVLESSRNI